MFTIFLYLNRKENTSTFQPLSSPCIWIFCRHFRVEIGIDKTESSVYWRPYFWLTDAWSMRTKFCQFFCTKISKANICMWEFVNGQCYRNDLLTNIYTVFLTMCLELGSNLNQTETAVKDEMVNLKYYTVLGKSKNWLFCVISRRFWGFVVSISARSKNQFLFNFFYFRGIWPSL